MITLKCHYFAYMAKCDSKKLVADFHTVFKYTCQWVGAIQCIPANHQFQGSSLKSSTSFRILAKPPDRLASIPTSPLVALSHPSCLSLPTELRLFFFFSPVCRRQGLISMEKINVVKITQNGQESGRLTACKSQPRPTSSQTQEAYHKLQSKACPPHNNRSSYYLRAAKTLSSSETLLEPMMYSPKSYSKLKLQKAPLPFAYYPISNYGHDS